MATIVDTIIHTIWNITTAITTILLNFVVILLFVSQTTRLENSTYNILVALNNEADFLYSTVDIYIEDAKEDDRQIFDWNMELNEDRYGKTSSDVKASIRKGS